MGEFETLYMKELDEKGRGGNKISKACLKNIHDILKGLSEGA